MLRSFSLAVLACALLPGCGAGWAEGTGVPGSANVGTRVVAVDVSQSAKDHWETLFPTARRLAEETRQGTRLAVFRFDVSVAEVYDGDGVLDAAEAGKLLKPLVEHRANTGGTNLALLVRRIEDRAKFWPAPVEVNVVTDCGTELMSQADQQYVRDIVESWRTDGRVKMRFHGVGTGHREAIRALAPGCEIVER